MLILACQKCGELQILHGSPDENGKARAMWTCGRCGAGQLVELSVTKDARRGDLRKIIGGLALSAAKDRNILGSSREGFKEEIKQER